ncbi:MAG: class I SAM-dependent methyltransferase [Mycobacteriales bacterium]
MPNSWLAALRRRSPIGSGLWSAKHKPSEPGDHRATEMAARTADLGVARPFRPAATGDEPAKTAATCPVCGGTAAEFFAARYVDVAKCGSPDCGHLWAVNAARRQGVQSVADPDAYGRFYAARNRDLARFFQSREFPPAGGRLLEMGAGTGHLIEFLRRRDPAIQIVAVEADEASLARLRRLGFEAFATLEEAPGPFDAINLVEVIEHIDDPVGLLRALHAKLSPGSRLFCTTPCGETRTGDRATGAYDELEHVQFFTERSLVRSFRIAGFADFTCETINALTSKLTPAPARYLKDVARPLRSALFGHRHLTGFARA